ncbi:MAG TPA: HD domain-containing protein [Turneriella sp.]|nr:HD domain-containing protein [Turneriella sp.]
MNAFEVLKALTSLPLDAEAQHLLEWELYWYRPAGADAAFAEDSKRETLPLRLSVSEETFARMKSSVDHTEADEHGITIPLAEAGRQPESLQVSTRAQQIIPDGVHYSATQLSAEGDLTLKDALLLCRLVARFPQLTVEASMAPADKTDLDALSQSFRRTIFRGIIMGRRPSAGLRLLDRFGLLEYFLPEVTAGRGLTQNRFHAHDIFEHLLRSVDGAMDLNEPVRWSALLHDIGKVPTRVETDTGEATFHNHEMYSARMVVPIMKRLAVPITVGQKVKFLVRNHMFHYTDEWSDKAVRRFVKKVPLEELQDLISLRLADRKGSGKKTAFPKALQKLIDHIDEIIAKEQEFKIKDLAVNGHTLMEMGIPASRQMGDILKYLHAEVAAGRAANETEILVSMVRQKMTEQKAE